MKVAGFNTNITRNRYKTRENLINKMIITKRSINRMIKLMKYWPLQSTVLYRPFSRSLIKHQEVRVRFAPSPTGHLHLGGLRTALYNYLFAKSKNGKFILRIEDTDQTRLVPEAAKKLEEMLVWAKLPPDESPSIGGPLGPYVQSQRSDLYKHHIQTLLNNGSAYKCFCSEFRLGLIRKDALKRREVPKYDNKCRTLTESKIKELEEKGSQYVIRLKLEDFSEPFNDLVYGSIFYNVAEHEGDPILMKSDGLPTYHFANVVDDHFMRITHVLRGVEWQVSTPKHILLYRAFGWTPPQFAHLPLLKNKDGSKMSKRQGDLHIEKIRSRGYSAISVLNFVTDIGGGFENREQNAVINISDLESKFHLSRLTTNSCRVEMEKLDFYNRLDIQSKLRQDCEVSQLIAELRDLLVEYYGDRIKSSCLVEMDVLSDEYLLQVLQWGQDRIHKLSDLLDEKLVYLWMVPQHLNFDNLPEISSSSTRILQCLIEDLSTVPEKDFEKELVTRKVKSLGKQFSLKVGIIMKLLRIAISGQEQGAPVGEMLSILGKTTSLARLQHAVSLLEKKS